MAFTDGTIAVAEFEQVVGQPGEWPYLPVVGMTAELEVYAATGGRGKVVGLMIKEDNRARGVGLLCQGGEREAGTVTTVVAADKLDAVGKLYEGIPEEAYVRPPDKLFTGIDAAEVVVIAGDHVDTQGGTEVVEFVLHTLTLDRGEVVVYQITGYQDEVGLLGVDETDVVGKLLLTCPVS